MFYGGKVAALIYDKSFNGTLLLAAIYGFSISYFAFAYASKLFETYN